MARTLKPNERLVCVGTTALRAPDGTHLPAVPMYVIVDEKTVDGETGLSSGEKELCEDIAAVFAPMFKKYIDGVNGPDGE